MSEETDPKLTRRDLLKMAAAGGLGLTGLAGAREANAVTHLLSGPPARHDPVIGMPFEPRDVVRIGVVGVGKRGMRHVHDLVRIPHVQIRAIADLSEANARGAQAAVTEAGQAAPALYTGGERDYEKLVQRDDLDLVYVAAPWDWHVPMAVAAMGAGKHVGIEVSAGTSIEDLWSLVDASERTRRHCVMLENVCYGYEELMVLNMVRSGLLGELKHAEAAYIHDLRPRLFDDERFSRRAYHIARDGNLYPTHGLGPVSLDLGINRGDRFAYMVSMSSPQLQLDVYREERLVPGDPRHGEVYRAGDINTSLIKTARGRTIMLQHDVVTPRPYSRINLVSGTRGTVMLYPDPVIFIEPPAREAEEAQPVRHDWEPLERYRDAYEHRFWREVGEIARRHGGHGGMDYVMSYRLTQTMREGGIPDMDVYDAAAWLAPGPLSALSVERGSAPVEFPDFTRGHWRSERATM